ncbi:MAG: GMC family oxidoreductase [Nitrospiraceae bacterium]
MILDAHTIPNGQTLTADLCIIGAGAAGITLAMELRATGLDILLLEAGGKTHAGASQQLYAGSVNDAGRHLPLDQARYRQLGGTTSLWGGRCIPFDPIDFQTRPWVPHSGWPISRTALDPFYRRAHVYCECGAYDYHVVSALPGAPTEMVAGLSDGAVSTSMLERWSPPTQFGKTYREPLARAERVRVLLHAIALELQCSPNGTRVETIRVGTLDGRRFAVRATTTVLTGGGLETTRLLLTSTGVHRTGIGNHSDWLGRGYMSHFHGTIARVHFTAGRGVMFGYETDPQGVFCRRHLALAEDIQRKHGLLNHYMVLDRPLLGDPTHGNAVLSAAFLFKRLFGGRQQEDLGSGKYALYWRHLKNVLQGSPQAVSILPKFGRRRFLQRRRMPSLLLGSRSNSYHLYFQSEQVPDRNSRVTLNETRDVLGIPRLHLNFCVSPQDYDSVLRAHVLVDEELRRQNVGHLTYLDRDVSSTIRESTAVLGHHLGTTRMSTDPTHGVVDTQCRIHGMTNLYVASSSIFPTASHANPTLTIVAMAIRLADHLTATGQRE